MVIHILLTSHSLSLFAWWRFVFTLTFAWFVVINAVCFWLPSCDCVMPSCCKASLIVDTFIGWGLRLILDDDLTNIYTWKIVKSLLVYMYASKIEDVVPFFRGKCTVREPLILPKRARKTASFSWLATHRQVIVCHIRIPCCGFFNPVLHL